MDTLSLSDALTTLAVTTVLVNTSLVTDDTASELEVVIIGSSSTDLLAPSL